MTQINPFIGSIIQSTQVQRTQSAEKDRHVQRVQTRAKDSAAAGDQFEHQVESADALSEIHDEDPRQPQQGKPRPRRKPTAPPSADGEGDDKPHIDVKV